MTPPRLVRSIASVTLSLAMLCSASSLDAGGIFGNVTFDELPFQSVDDVEIAGVSFSYQVDGAPSPDAFFGSFGPGQLTHVNDPSLLGDTNGVLRIDFGTPANYVSFGVALNEGADVVGGVVATIINEENLSIDTLEIDTVAVDPTTFSEALVEYAGGPFSAVELRFPSTATRFALDNLRFAVPEPGSLVVALAAMLSVAARRATQRGSRVKNIGVRWSYSGN